MSRKNSSQFFPDKLFLGLSICACLIAPGPSFAERSTANKTLQEGSRVHSDKSHSDYEQRRVDQSDTNSNFNSEESGIEKGTDRQNDMNPGD